MLRTLWTKWKAFAHALGTFQARVLLSVFYVVILMPFALITTLFRDPLKIKARGPVGSFWTERSSEKDSTFEEAGRQY